MKITADSNIILFSFFVIYLRTVTNHSHISRYQLSGECAYSDVTIKRIVHFTSILQKVRVPKTSITYIVLYLKEIFNTNFKFKKKKWTEYTVNVHVILPLSGLLFVGSCLTTWSLAVLIELVLKWSSGMSLVDFLLSHKLIGTSKSCVTTILYPFDFLNTVEPQ